MELSGYYSFTEKADMKTITEILSSGGTGLHYGNRIVLPFHCHFLKVIIENDIITDFSSSSKGIFIREKEDFTDVYFLDYKNLQESVSKYENIKMLVVEKGKSIFNQDNHLKLVAYLEENHNVKIEKTDEDILFIE